MKLYIANCSKQEHHFTYMLPENMRPFSMDIRAGAQIVIDNDPSSISAIIKQHEVYGFQEVKKIKRNFGGLCYQIDKVISIDAIVSGFTQTEQEQIERAKSVREITAVAADDILAKKAQEFGIRQTGTTEFEVKEEQRNFADTDPKFMSTVEVSRDGLKLSKDKKKRK